MRVVVIGSGLGGVTVAEALAQAGHDATIVTAETHGYYSRPRLSHGTHLDDAKAASIVMKPYAAVKAKVLSGVRVERIDREGRRIFLSDHSFLEYEKLVLATGSAARIPPPLRPFQDRFLTLNSLEDLLAIRACRKKVLSAGKKPRWAIIGGGLIGCELASDLNKAGDEVTIFHRENRLMELVFNEQESQALHEHFAKKGVEVRYDQKIDGIDSRFDGFDAIVVSTGFAPRVELAKEAGLAVGRGIVVDGFLRTSDPSIYAVGDVAEVAGKLYPFVSPIRHQALWLADHLAGKAAAPWAPPAFTPVIKVHDWKRPQPATV